MRRLRIQVVGHKPLMMDPMTDETLTGLATGVRAEIKKDTPDSEVCAKKIYRDSKGRVALPSTMLFAALVGAGRSVSYKGKTNISTADTTKLPAFVDILDEYLVIPGAEKDKEPEWIVDKRRGRLDSGVAVCLRRPKFEKWGFTVTLDFDDNEIGQDKVEKLFEVAGRFQGLGSFRPSCKGPFGSFKTVKVDDITPPEMEAENKQRKGSSKSEPEAADETGEGDEHSEGELVGAGNGTASNSRDRGSKA